MWETNGNEGNLPSSGSEGASASREHTVEASGSENCGDEVAPDGFRNTDNRTTTNGNEHNVHASQSKFPSQPVEDLQHDTGNKKSEEQGTSLVFQNGVNTTMESTGMNTSNTGNRRKRRSWNSDEEKASPKCRKLGTTFTC